jgi:hypothetical protein
MKVIVIITRFGQFIVAAPGLLQVSLLLKIMLGTESLKGEIYDVAFEQYVYYTDE